MASRDALLEIEDRGALPFVLAARLEAVIRRQVKTDKEYLLPVLPQNIYTTARDAERVSRLYLPGNNPKLMINAGIYGCHGIILDLEDSVAPDRKYEARFLVRNALRQVDFYGAERMVQDQSASCRTGRSEICHSASCEPHSGAKMRIGQPG